MNHQKGNKTVEPFRIKDEIARLKAASKANPRDACLLIVGLNLGLRAKDLLSLRWTDLLSISAKQKGIREKIRIAESKTGKTAIIVIPPACKRAIEVWWKECDYPFDGYVFPSRKRNKNMQTRPINVSSFYTLINKWAHKADIHGHFGTHSLRKTFGYFFRQAGGSIELLMERFSHSSPTITRRYIGITDDEVAAIALKVDL